MTEPDFISPDVPAEDRMAQVRGVTAALAAKSAEVVERRRELEALEREVWELSSKTVPDAMAAAGVDRCGLPELGVDVRLEDWTRAVLPKGEARDQAVDWLVEHGHGDLIKSTVRAEFGRREHNAALAVAEQLRAELPGHAVGVQEDVHHMTYTAWAKERRQEGETLPLDLLGISVGRVAKVVVRDEGR